VHAGLADDDRAGIAKPSHSIRIAPVEVEARRARSCPRRHVAGQVIVLDRNGYAMQRPDPAAVGNFRGRPGGLFQCVVGDHNKTRKAFVKRFDALKVCFCKRDWR